MATQDFKRKLAAILHADVKGYSRLIGEDESATVHTLTTYREAMGMLIQKHRGRVVHGSGDSLLAEFISVIDAVQCAVEIQKELKTRNAELSENRKVEFRIGVNLGDVIEKDEDLHGDGVNIAARIEGLAEGGGICISRTAFDQVRNKLKLGYEYIGEHSVKNIAQPVRVYRVLTEPEAAGKVIGEKMAPPKQRWKLALTAVVTVIVVAITVTLWNTYFRPPSVEVASVEKMAFPLPDKPSIAVLPFDNLSGDPAQEYFSDGITEEIITSLSKVPQLFVIARNSTFTYKNKPVKIQLVAEELGVRYVLEGSVRRSGEKVRVTAQLIDAITGVHLWAERYDRELKDIFAVQDEVTKKIITALQVKLTQGEQARTAAKGTSNLEAYLKIMQARVNLYRANTETVPLARQLAEEAISLDPGYATAYRMLGVAHMHSAFLGISKSPKQSVAKALELAKKALELDDADGYSHAVLGFLLALIRQYDKAVVEAERGVALDPNVADIHAWSGSIYRYVGRWEESILAYKKAIRLNPIPPGWYLFGLGLAYGWTGQYDEAITECQKAVRDHPNSLYARMFMTLVYSFSGRNEEARAEAAEVLKINPKFNLEAWEKRLRYKNKDDHERFINTLRKAGLPNKPPLPLPDKPSIAVLAFDNLSGDPEQEYFSDGIAEDIITSLSKMDRLFVIARSSSFTYKGKPVKVQKISRELGVKYVLEGSVQKDENRLRITAQLIDATTGNHLWAERYDRDLKDIFVLQDEINMKILSALQIKLTHGEQARIWAKGTDNLEAYLKLMQAHENFIKINIEGNALARQMAEKTITLDPKYADAYSLLGKTHIMDMFLGTSKSPRDSLAQAEELLQKAIALDDSSADARSRLGILYTMMRQHDKGIAEIERAVALNPNFALAHFRLGWALRFAGRPEEAIPAIEKALRLNPFPPNSYLWGLGTCYLYTGKCEEAIDTCEKFLQGEVDSHLSYVVATVIYSMCGKEEKASETAEGVLKMNPKFSCTYFAKTLPYKNKDDLDRYMAALKKAGLK